jgi:transcriptional regulator with XRE-family HTH domain
MSVEENLKEMICREYGSIRQFAQKIDVKYSTVMAILRRGVKNSNIDNVIKICHELNISVDALAHGKIVMLPHIKATYSTEVNELPELINAYIAFYENNVECTLDYIPLTVDEMDFFTEGVNFLFEQIRNLRRRASKLPRNKYYMTEDFEKKVLKENPKRE